MHCIADDLVCKNVVFLICGYDQAQMNETMMSTIASHIPAGTSAFTIVHYGQEYKKREQSQTLLRNIADCISLFFRGLLFWWNGLGQ